MLLVDKYRPSKLENLSYHPEITSRLRALANHAEGMPHLFFYGPSGSGKKTRVSALLQELYGSGASKLKLDKRTFTTPSKKTLDINLVTSNYHIEIAPGDAGLNDRLVVQEVIKDIASNKNIAAATMGSAASKERDNDDTEGGVVKKSGGRAQFKTVVLVEVDRLSRQAQAALRRTMEKYSSTCRLILICNNQSKVIEPVRSRCLGIRVPAPSHQDICEVLEQVAKWETISLPKELAMNIARESSRNLRRALLMFEACHVHQRNGLTKDTAIIKTDWELYIRQLAIDVTREQTPQRLMAAREKMYELLVNCIPPVIILKTLVSELLKNLDDSLKHEVVEWAAFYEHRLSQGSKEIFHLEAFLAKYMALYKKYLNDMFA